MNSAITTVLRVGVIVSVAVMLIGIAMTLAGHPSAFTSRPADAHFPNTFAAVLNGVRHGDAQAIIMAGLLVLIATPVARVALSVIIFIIARDRLYAKITAAVLAILFISFAVGLVGR